MKEVFTNETELKEFVGNTLVSKLVPQKNRAFLLFLKGELGAGKTTLTKHLAKILGANRSIVSPTFILERDYTLDASASFKTLVHIDAYRFDNPNEATVLDVGRHLKNEHTLVIIEWPEKMSDLLPKPDLELVLEHRGAEARGLTMYA